MMTGLKIPTTEHREFLFLITWVLIKRLFDMNFMASKKDCLPHLKIIRRSIRELLGLRSGSEAENEIDLADWIQIVGGEGVGMELKNAVVQTIL